MIGSISSNRSLFTSAAVVVVSSVVLGVFLSRMGWHGAMQQYPAAMYALMVGGGAAFAVMTSCLRREKKLPDVELSIEQKIVQLLNKPPEREDNFLDTLQKFGLSTPICNIVVDYVAFPIEKIFLKLKMGIPLPVEDPKYSSIKASLISYAKVCGVATDHLLDLRSTRAAYSEVRRFVKRLDDRGGPEPYSMDENTEICHIATLLFHKTSDGIRISYLEDPGSELCDRDKLIDILVHCPVDYEAGLHLFAHLDSESWKALLCTPSSFLSEERAILFLDEYLKETGGTLKDDSFYLRPYIERGWLVFLCKVLKAKSERARDSYSLWFHLFDDRANTKDLESPLSNQYVKKAIGLLQARIPLANKFSLDGESGMTPHELIEKHHLTDLQKLFALLDEIRGKPFSHVLNAQELVTFNERIKQEGFVT